MLEVLFLGIYLSVENYMLVCVELDGHFMPLESDCCSNEV